MVPKEINWIRPQGAISRFSYLKDKYFCGHYSKSFNYLKYWSKDINDLKHELSLCLYLSIYLCKHLKEHITKGDVLFEFRNPQSQRKHHPRASFNFCSQQLSKEIIPYMFKSRPLQHILIVLAYCLNR